MVKYLNQMVLWCTKMFGRVLFQIQYQLEKQQEKFLKTGGEKISLGRSILLTRPIKQSENFKKMLLGKGVEQPIIISPLAKIAFSNFSKGEFKEIKAFLVTSTNAIEAIKENKTFCSYISRKRIPIFCVGTYTTKIGKACGLNSQFLGFNATLLEENLIKKLARKNFNIYPEEICYLRGRKVARNIAKHLGLKERVVYSQIGIEINPDTVNKTIIGEVGHIFFFSKNTVDLFFDKINAIDASTNIFCFSENIRNKVIDRMGHEKENVYFSLRPVSSDMVNLFISKN